MADQLRESLKSGNGNEEKSPLDFHALTQGDDSVNDHAGQSLASSSPALTAGNASPALPMQMKSDSIKEEVVQREVTPESEGPAEASPIEEGGDSGTDMELVDPWEGQEEVRVPSAGTDSELVDPWSVQSELARLLGLQRRRLAADQVEGDGPAANNLIQEGIQQLSNRFLGDAEPADQERFAELLRAYLQAAATATLSSEGDVPEETQRQQSGFDAMAQIISQHTFARHTSSNASEDWQLSESEDLMAFLHQMGYWEDLERRVVNVAQGEFAAWSDSDTGRQRQETDRRGGQWSNGEDRVNLMERLQDYWGAGINRSAWSDTRARRSGTGDGDTARERATSRSDNPWSAVFISYLMQQAGASDTFDYANGHASYAATARENQGQSRVTHPSRLFNARGQTMVGDEAINSGPEAVRVGALIHRPRGGEDGSRSNLDASNVREGDTSHSDLVVDIMIFDGNGRRVPGNYEEILNAPEGIPDDYQIIAMTIGGNTNDNILDPSQNMGAVTEPPHGRQTVGRNYYLLNRDLTILRNLTDSSMIPYGIQRMDSPSPEEMQNPL